MLSADKLCEIAGCNYNDTLICNANNGPDYRCNQLLRCTQAAHEVEKQAKKSERSRILALIREVENPYYQGSGILSDVWDEAKQAIINKIGGEG